MLLLLKIKYNMILKKNIFLLCSIVTFISCIFIFFYAIAGKTSGNVLLGSFSSLVSLTNFFWIVSIMVCIAYLFNVYIINDYLTKKTNLLYTYSFSKNDHVISNFILIALEVVIITVISYVIFMLTSIYIVKPLFLTSGVLDYIFIKQNLIKIIFISCMMILSIGFMLYISYKFKSTTIAFITSFLLSIFISMTITGFELNISFEIFKTLILALICLVGISLSLRMSK